MRLFGFRDGKIWTDVRRRELWRVLCNGRYLRLVSGEKSLSARPHRSVAVWIGGFWGAFFYKFIPNCIYLFRWNGSFKIKPLWLLVFSKSRCGNGLCINGWRKFAEFAFGLWKRGVSRPQTNRQIKWGWTNKKDFDLYEICEEEPTSIKNSIELRDFSMDITVKTKHGGIITIEKMLDGKLEQWI